MREELEHMSLYKIQVVVAALVVSRVHAATTISKCNVNSARAAAGDLATTHILHVLLPSCNRMARLLLQQLDSQPESQQETPNG